MASLLLLLENKSITHQSPGDVRDGARDNCDGGAMTHGLVQRALWELFFTLVVQRASAQASQCFFFSLFVSSLQKRSAAADESLGCRPYAVFCPLLPEINSALGNKRIRVPSTLREEPFAEHLLTRHWCSYNSCALFSMENSSRLAGYALFEARYQAK